MKGINALRKSDPPPAPASTERECGDCALKIPLKAKKCAYCGREQEPFAPIRV